MRIYLQSNPIWKHTFSRNLVLYHLMEALDYGFTGVMVTSIGNTLGIYENLNLSDIYEQTHT